MRQLFEIGEQVIADFKNYPENNGEYTILEVLTPEQMKEEFREYSILQSIYYRLDGLTIVGPRNGTICNAAGQSALRKKHKPSELSFTELMTNLSTKIQERI